MGFVSKLQEDEGFRWKLTHICTPHRECSNQPTSPPGINTEGGLSFIPWLYAVLLLWIHFTAAWFDWLNGFICDLQTPDIIHKSSPHSLSMTHARTIIRDPLNRLECSGIPAQLKETCSCQISSTDTDVDTESTRVKAMTLAHFKLDANCDLKIGKPVISEKKEGWEEMGEMISTIRYWPMENLKRWVGYVVMRQDECRVRDMGDPIYGP